MLHHPHLHCLVPAGGLSLDRSRWIACRERFFLPVARTQRSVSQAIPALLAAALPQQKLRLSGQASRFETPEPSTALSTSRRPRNGWSMPSVPSAARSTYSSIWPVTLTALPSPTDASSRLDNGQVTFRWRDSADRQRPKAHDTRRRRVHPPLPDARAAARIRQDPALRVSVQRQPPGKPPAVPFTAAAAACGSNHPPHRNPAARERNLLGAHSLPEQLPGYSRRAVAGPQLPEITDDELYPNSSRTLRSKLAHQRPQPGKAPPLARNCRIRQLPNGARSPYFSQQRPLHR